MTALIGIQTNKFVALCSDRRISLGLITNTCAESKIFRKDNLYIGFTGRAALMDVIKYDWKIPTKPEDMSDNEYIYRLLKSLKSFGTEYDKNNGKDEIFKNFGCIISYNGTLIETNSTYERMPLSNGVFSSSGCCYSLIEGILKSETHNVDVANLTEDQCEFLFKKCLKIASAHSSGISKEGDIFFDYKNDNGVYI